MYGSGPPLKFPPVLCAPVVPPSRPCGCMSVLNQQYESLPPVFQSKDRHCLCSYIGHVQHAVGHVVTLRRETLRRLINDAILLGWLRCKVWMVAQAIMMVPRALRPLCMRQIAGGGHVVRTQVQLAKTAGILILGVRKLRITAVVWANSGVATPDQLGHVQ